MGRIKHTKNHLRETLGISQEDMGMLLKIHPSQIAMYETGKRELPGTAYIKLLNMCIHVEKMMETMPEHFHRENENEKIVALIEKELDAINYNQIKCSRKLTEIKEKYQKAIANCHLADYMETQHPEENHSASHSNFYRQMGNSKMEKYGPVAQFQLNFQLETLKFQQQCLEEELKKAKSFTLSE